MSFQIAPAMRPRLNRSQLAVPGSSPRFLEKALAIPADIVMFDLEDAVAPDEKEQARRNVIAAINDLDWGTRTLSVRINGLDTHFMYRDVIDIVEQAGARLDLIMVPKVGTPADVYAVDMLITQIEAAKGRAPRVGIELLIETALGMQNVAAIAAASPRIESLHFGSGDYAASTGMRTVAIGGPSPDYRVLADAGADGERTAYWNDIWHHPLASIIVAARANGRRPVDGPYANFKDTDGFIAAAKRSAALGCEGKWVIHPSQVEMANELFTPSAAEVERARRILGAMQEAGAKGQGAVTLDGRMIDIASIRQAETLIRKADAIAALAS
jgi:malyl-CoA/(S)-citramalyl-CoA lyase